MYENPQIRSRKFRIYTMRWKLIRKKKMRAVRKKFVGLGYVHRRRINFRFLRKQES